MFANRISLIRGDGVCLPDECSGVHLQGRQFGKKGSAEVKSLLQKNSLLNKLTCNQDPLTFEVLQLERYFQSGVKAKSLVAQALTNTNSNIFNVSAKSFIRRRM